MLQGIVTGVKSILDRVSPEFGIRSARMTRTTLALAEPMTLRMTSMNLILYGEVFY